MKTREIPKLHFFMFIFSFGLSVLFLVSCEKEKMPFEQPLYEYETDSLVDVDGNVYKTVKIGDQWWMAENLKVSRYRNKVLIYSNGSMSQKEWAGLKKGAYCYLFDSSVPFNGYLYNWNAVKDPNGLAPEGWRIPSDEDWKKLELFIGTNADTVNLTGWRGSDTGGKLKSPKGQTFFWEVDMKIHNTNQSGFTAYPGGCRLYNGSFSDAGQYSTGFWWSSSENGTDQAWYRYLDYKYGGVFRNYAPQASGFSIRCVKDE